MYLGIYMHIHMSNNENRGHEFEKAKWSYEADLEIGKVRMKWFNYNFKKYKKSFKKFHVSTEGSLFL